MIHWKIARAVALTLLMAGAGCKAGCGREATAGPARPAGPNRLVAFTSRAEIDQFVKDAQERARKKRERETRARGGAMAAPQSATTEGALEADATKADGAESITNNQHAGVDEGGIVKVHGNHLVVLRRGRLFSLKVGDASLSPVSVADCYGPNVSPAGAWYDEMLVAGDTIAVIGYSYQRGGTEVGLFGIDGDGKISYRSTYHLRSNDYYSSRNYASRLIGNKLVLYAPLYVPIQGGDTDASKWLPAVRRWSPAATPSDFVSILEPSRIYRPIDPSDQLALHTVTTCDLAKGDFACTARAVMGPPGRVFYVSQDSVFVWMTPWSDGDAEKRSRSLLYRLPLTGEEPSVLRVSGGPIDQFSFLEGADHHLNVLVRSEAAGEAMWLPESTTGDLALLRVPLSSFNRGAEPAPISAYARLPKPEGYVMQNRFVGDYVLYGTGSSWGHASPKPASKLVAYRYASEGKSASSEMALGHGVDRIEAMGRDAVVVGGDGKDLVFSGIALGATPTLAGRYTRAGAAQGELRSHGFFYKPEGDARDQRGLFGLPIRGNAQPGYAHLTEGSASILFVRNERLAFREVGQLESDSSAAVHRDGCKASCVDWYGNARPIFLRGRLFALLGYEIVEGRQDSDGHVQEVRRTNFAPSGAR